MHELVPGYCRSLALDKRFAVLCVHRACHNMLERKTIPVQLAYLFLSRMYDFDLEKYYELIQRRWPDWSEVKHHISEISCGREV